MRCGGSARHRHAHRRHRDTDARAHSPAVRCVTVHPLPRRVDAPGSRLGLAELRTPSGSPRPGRPRLRRYLMTLGGRLRGRVPRTPTSGEDTLSRAKGDVPRKWPASEPRARPSILHPRRADGPLLSKSRRTCLLSDEGGSWGIFCSSLSVGDQRGS